MFLILHGPALDVIPCSYAMWLITERHAFNLFSRPYKRGVVGAAVSICPMGNIRDFAALRSHIYIST